MNRFWFSNHPDSYWDWSLGLKGNPVQNRSCPRNCKSAPSQQGEVLLHHLAIFRLTGEKAGKSQTSQETCLDQLILCFRRKSEEDLSISQPTWSVVKPFISFLISLKAESIGLNLFDRI